MKSPNDEVTGLPGCYSIGKLFCQAFRRFSANKPFWVNPRCCPNSTL